MALVLKDRVKETTASTGTGTVTLAGAVSGFQNFAVIGDGNSTYYVIADPATGDWEVGIGTYTASGTTLSRTTVLSSSNAGSLVSFAAGTKDVFVSYPSSRAVYQNEAGTATVQNEFTTINADTVNVGTANITAGTVSTTPSSANDLVNKTYVDTLVASGIHFHQPVRVESPTALTATYNNGTAGVGATLTNAGTQAALEIDGVTVSVADRVLIYTQSTQTQNGIYVVTDVGSGSTNWILTRSSDADTYVINSANGLSEGSTVFVQQGATGAGETYTCSTSGVITFGTTNITFAQISSAQIYSAGTGLTLSGTQFSITNTGTAGTYGDAATVPVFTTNAQGQVTSVTPTAIAISGAAVSGNIAGQAGSVANALTAGTYLTSGGTYDGSAARTFAVDATSANTADKVVARDASGNFSAGTITATLSGAATSATTATNLAGGAVNQIAVQSGAGATTFVAAPTASGQVLGWNGSAFAYTTTIDTATNVSGTVAVANGGTGATSLTANNVILGNGTSAVQVVAPGTSGNVLTSNGTTWASSAPAAPTGPTVTAVASGSLSDGSTVIVNADGTVSVAGSVAPSAGTPVVYTSASVSDVAAGYDASAQRVVIVYRNDSNSSFGTAVVGTVSGTSISFGTPVVFNSAGTFSPKITYDANAKRMVIIYATAGFGGVVVGTVSGTSISFGTPVSLSVSISEQSITYHPVAQRVVITYRSNTGRAQVGTVSGTSISFGSATVFNNNDTFDTAVTYDANSQRVVIAYCNGGNSFFGTAIVGTVSGTSISFGSPVVIQSANSNDFAINYDAAAQRVVVAYYNASNSNFGTVAVGTVSGTSISFGTPVVFNSAGSYDAGLTYDANAQRTVLTYRNVSIGTALVGTVSGTSISFGTPVVFQATNSPQFISSTYDSAAQRVVIPYQIFGPPTNGSAVVFNTGGTNLTTENFIGFSNATYTNGQTATIQIVGAVDDAQSGLTPGQSYFVQNDGTLGLTAANPSVFAGTAVASNKIIVKG